MSDQAYIYRCSVDVLQVFSLPHAFRQKEFRILGATTRENLILERARFGKRRILQIIWDLSTPNPVTSLVAHNATALWGALLSVCPKTAAACTQWTAFLVLAPLFFEGTQKTLRPFCIWKGRSLKAASFVLSTLYLSFYLSFLPGLFTWATLFVSSWWCSHTVSWWARSGR